MATRAASAIEHHVLRENAERAAEQLSAIIESIPAPVFIGSQAGISRVNRAALELTGYAEAANRNRCTGPVHVAQAPRASRTYGTSARPLGAGCDFAVSSDGSGTVSQPTSHSISSATRRARVCRQ